MVAHLTMPRLSQDMETGRVEQWLKKEGDRVQQGEPILVVETDKAMMDVEAPASGVLRRVTVAAGADVAVGSLLAIIAEPDEILPDDQPTAVVPTPEPAATPPATSPGQPSTPEAQQARGAGRGGRQPVSPAARRVAASLGVDLAAVTGSGEGGLVTEADVRAFATSRPSADEATIVPLTGIRRRIAERLSLSRRTVADVTTVIDVEMSGVAAARKESGLSYTAYVAWAAARTLPTYPTLNASLREDEVHLHRSVDLGVAVALEDGLVVPVVRGAERLDVREIASAIDNLAARMRAGEATPQELSGSTFTVTNSGTFGSLFFTPIINLPEVAILGMGRVADTPVVRDGAVTVGKVMYLCLSYDHRVVDGSTAVSYLADVKRRLEAIGPGREPA